MLLAVAAGRDTEEGSRQEAAWPLGEKIKRSQGGEGAAPRRAGRESREDERRTSDADGVRSQTREVGCWCWLGLGKAASWAVKRLLG